MIVRVGYLGQSHKILPHSLGNDGRSNELVTGNFLFQLLVQILVEKHSGINLLFLLSFGPLLLALKMNQQSVISAINLNSSDLLLGLAAAAAFLSSLSTFSALLPLATFLVVLRRRL